MGRGTKKIKVKTCPTFTVSMICFGQKKKKIGFYP